ncbi:RagB/SusD family nutrient uptake outer membrane protein [Pedobacter sp. UYP1]|uniref:RagB/SusD family nutrient uptake outer membrane protein n=1 Tax=Pedobacter sp. UYP1 TaxID=1756396 RepID=UPI003399CBF9
MNRLYKNISAVLSISCLICFLGCKKFLDEKTNKKLAVPTTLNDFQALLDDPSVTNFSSPISGEISSDDYYLTDAKWNGLASLQERRMYIWEKDNLFESGFNDWRNVYSAIYSYNTVLQGTDKIPREVTNAVEWDNIKGQALYCRANSYLEGVIIWGLAYDESTAGVDLGMPLKTNTVFSESSERANIRQTYELIIQDLKASVVLLPMIPLSKFRASKPAAYGLLARTYLSMRDYENAFEYADSCLSLKKDILDFNTLSFTGTYPFNFDNNTEVIYYKGMRTLPIISGTMPIVLPNSLDNYNVADLRKQIFFKKNPDNTYRFRGGYSGSTPFSGLATNEIFLIKAECLARKGEVMKSMGVMNGLLIKRWNNAKIYVPCTAASSAEALSIILKERRKELIMRGLRWMDIKRLNKEGANIALSRSLNNKIYELLPNDLRYALPIPEDVISLSGMEQNKR